jgi:NAD(P)-dependent dehydrogenase (short-subunit alcohol dehydrogenase family)
VIRFDSSHWALILGGSSGMGLATAKRLARHGMSVCVVHRDRQGAMERIEREFDEIRSEGTDFLAFNTDALDPEARASVLTALAARMGSTERVRALLHSIAFGNLKPLVPKAAGDAVIRDEDMARTVYAMGTSLLSWVQELHERGMFASDARVFGLTSEGNEVAWPGYAAVSAAKLALESVSRSIATEFARYGIRSNVLQPGVTDTPALRLIPGHERMRAEAERRNPLGRLTSPDDVAALICLLCTEEAAWVNGALIRVDGGERVSPGLESSR